MYVEKTSMENQTDRNISITKGNRQQNTRQNRIQTKDHKIMYSTNPSSHGTTQTQTRIEVILLIM